MARTLLLALAPFDDLLSESTLVCAVTLVYAATHHGKGVVKGELRREGVEIHRRRRRRRQHSRGEQPPASLAGPVTHSDRGTGALTSVPWCTARVQAGGMLIRLGRSSTCWNSSCWPVCNYQCNVWMSDRMPCRPVAYRISRCTGCLYNKLTGWRPLERSAVNRLKVSYLSKLPKPALSSIRIHFHRLEINLGQTVGALIKWQAAVERSPQQFVAVLMICRKEGPQKFQKVQITHVM